MLRVHFLFLWLVFLSKAVLLSVLKNPETCAESLEGVMELMRLACHSDPASAAQLLSAGGAAVVIDLLRSRPNQTKLAVSAIGVLSALATSGGRDVADQMRVEGVVAVMAIAMEHQQTDSALSRDGAAALALLADTNGRIIKLLQTCV